MTNKYEKALKVCATYWRAEGYDYAKHEDKCEKAYQDLKELVCMYEDCKYELCLKCGKYKNSHLGACNDCRFKED